MKRIAFITDNLLSIGGVQRVLSVIAIALSKDNDVTVITLEDTKHPDYSLYDLDKSNVQIKHFHPKGQQSILTKGYSYLYKKLQPKNKVFSDLYSNSSFPYSLRTQFIQELNDGNFDTIIAVHGGLSIKLATIRKHLNARNVIGWMHNSYEAFFLKENCYYPSLENHFKWQLQKLNKFVVLCKTDAQIYKEKMGILPVAIYNPLTLKPGHPSLCNQKRFLSIGRMTEGHKGFDILIDAFAEFAKTNNEWTLEIVGEGPEEHALREQIRRYNLEDRVMISSFTQNIQQHYSNASIYILSSRWEGMPLVLVEALSHGLPIISSDIPISREILPNDVASFFETGNSSSLVQCMSEFESILAKASHTIEYSRRYTIERIVTKWKEIL